MSEIPKLLTVSDLVTRWDMPRQSIHQKFAEADFPKPIQYVSNGRIALLLESDIEEFEKTHPWISDPAKRQARANFIFRKIMNGELQ
ncbi:hypothetical protein KHA93_22930 [Bacillus sp. FJAT-49732]|uniref:Uncharacterized protein n=1 Tax=Lederbergia citrisecunda TaxID=2833583 RepID=A0A942YQP3_9BACI|nr:hypothetical protein [Lederbergia citrisecunda]MBS4202461.1 hypothetical protein [Lederbergia citrisecunda]